MGSGEPCWGPASWSSLQYAWHRGRSLASPTLELFHHQKPGDRSRDRSGGEQTAASYERHSQQHPGGELPSVLHAAAVAGTIFGPWPQFPHCISGLTAAGRCGADSKNDLALPPDWPHPHLSHSPAEPPESKGRKLAGEQRDPWERTPRHSAVPGAFADGGRASTPPPQTLGGESQCAPSFGFPLAPMVPQGLGQGLEGSGQ